MRGLRGRGTLSLCAARLESRRLGPCHDTKCTSIRPIGRGVTLTRAGQAFAARVRLGLSLISEAFGPDSRGRSKRLVVSTLPSIASKILLPGLEGLRSLVPNIALEIRLTEDLEQFRNSDVDIAVRFGPGDWAGLASQHISAETLFPVCSPAFRDKHLLAHPTDLLACPLIGHPSSSWKLWFDPIGLDFKAVTPWLTLEDAGVAIDAASLGHGIALARGRLARGDLAGGRVVRLFEHEVSAEYQYSCVTRA